MASKGSSLNQTTLKYSIKEIYKNDNSRVRKSDKKRFKRSTAD